MTLADIDWTTITKAQASRLLGPAKHHEQSLALKWNLDEAKYEIAWKAAMDLEEDLLVFVRCGLKPGEH